MVGAEATNQQEATDGKCRRIDRAARSAGLQRRDLRVGAVSGKHFRHHFTRFRARQGFTLMGNAMESVEDHLTRNCKG